MERHHRVPRDAGRRGPRPHGPRDLGSLGRPARLLTVLASIAGVLLSGGLVWRVSDAAFTATTSGAGSWAAGSVVLSDDDSGLAAFAAERLVPGDSGSRCLTVSYTGTLPARVRLYGTGVTGIVARHLDVTVDVGAGGGYASCAGFVPTARIFSGTLADLAAEHASYLTGVPGFDPPGPTDVVYRITYVLDAATPDTAQDALAVADFVWEARDTSDTSQVWGAPRDWTFEYRSDGDPGWSPMRYLTNDSIWSSGTAHRFCAVTGPDQQHPGDDCSSSRTWVAPWPTSVSIGTAGAITVDGPCGGNSQGVAVAVYHGTTRIWPAAGPLVVANGESVPGPANLTATVAAGDLLRFVVAGNGPTSNCDSTTWNPTVTVTGGRGWRGAEGHRTGPETWAHEYSTDGGATFVPMSWNGSWAWQGDAFPCLVASTSFQHPSVTCRSARTWIAPATETVTVATSGPVTVAAPCLGNTAGVALSVLRGTTRVWPAAGEFAVPNGASATPPVLEVPVQAGDRLRFVVEARGGSDGCDSTQWPVLVSRP